MTSIMTNTAAMAALQTMRSINSDMESTQARISSGYRVETASDNAAYWSIATTMRSDSDALSTVQDALGLGAAKVDTAYTGMDSAIEVVSEIKNKLKLLKHFFKSTFFIGCTFVNAFVIFFFVHSLISSVLVVVLIFT